MCLLILCAVGSVGAWAQCSLGGRVVDGADGQGIPGASVAVMKADKLVRGVPTNVSGAFSVDSLAAGDYTVRVSFVGYNSFEKNITLVKGQPTRLGRIKLSAEDRQIDEVKVVQTVQRQEQRGDTTVFNAAAFKVNPDATTEDLLRKMPGMQVKDGQVTHGGETVKKVLVDGKEFFGSDPSVALKNIDASMVDKIEVFDKQSDQAEFTGFSDGNEQRTLNILTKMGVRSGCFGRVYGGYGTDKHYEAGGNANFFRGDHRITALASLNNVNSRDGGGRSGGGGSDGLTTAGNVGLNYSFEKENAFRVEANYLFDHKKNEKENSTEQEYFQTEGQDSLHTYRSESESQSRNNNHRVDMRMKWTLNPNNSLSFDPNWSWSGSNSESANMGLDLRDSVAYQSTEQLSGSHSSSYSLGASLTWRHKFSVPRRTISLGASVSHSKSTSDGSSQNLRSQQNGKGEVPNTDSEGGVGDTPSSGTTDSTTPPDKPDGGGNQTPESADIKTLATAQQSDNDSHSLSVTSRLIYTEPIGDNLALQVNYSPSYSLSSNDKRVSADSVSVASSLSDVSFSDYRFSALLSNKKESRYLVHRAGVGLRAFSGKRFKAAVGIDVQKSILRGEQSYPYEFETDRSFFSLMPSAELSISADRRFNLRFKYRTSSSAPSISQLQNVVDVSNIRRYSAGNPDLAQSNTHQLRLHMAANNTETSRFFFLMTSVSFTNDYVGTSTVIASADSVVAEGVVLPAGTQFSKPVNLDGYLSAMANMTFSTPVKWLGSNVSFSLGANFQKTPSYYNGALLNNRTYSVSGGINIGSSLSENLDFNVAYNPSYNIVSSTQTAASNYNYYRHSLRADLNTLFVNQHLVFNTSLAHNYSNGMGDGFDANYLTWNAAIAVKFLSNRQAELRLRVNDILNNSQSSSRSIQDAYIQTSSSNVLRRYAMLTFSYKFKTLGAKDENVRDFPGGRGMGPGGHGGPPPRQGM